jgi:hypothetical protein
LSVCRLLFKLDRIPFLTDSTGSTGQPAQPINIRFFETAFKYLNKH